MKHVVALRAFTHAGESFAAGPIRIDAGHFGDWKAAGLVREPTDAEMAKLKGEQAAPRVAPKRARKVTPAAPVAAPVAASVPEPVVADTDPAAPAA